MSLVMAVGLGPNSLEIPLMIFNSMSEGRDYISKILGEPKNHKGELTADRWYTYGVFELDRENKLDEAEDEDAADAEFEKLYAHFFKDGKYYGGCGACHEIILKEIETGTPLVGWDLD